MNSTLLQFIREHGTPKLRAAPEDTLRRYLTQRHVRFIWIPGRALGIGWEQADGPLYVANVMAVDAAATVELVREFVRQYPWVREIEADRVPMTERQTNLAHPGRRRRYPLALLDRLARQCRRRSRVRPLSQRNFAFA